MSASEDVAKHIKSEKDWEDIASAPATLDVTQSRRNHENALRGLIVTRMNLAIAA